MTTIGGVLQNCRSDRPEQGCPFWPPDLFAICGSILKLSGAYLRIFNDSVGSWENSHKPGTEWRRTIDKLRVVSEKSLKRKVPAEVRDLWKFVLLNRSTDLALLADHGVVQALLTLTLVADAASAGLGVTKNSDPFLTAAQDCLEDNNLESFCWEVDRTQAAVLGKQHTPQRGATFRSLTHHLALYAAGEIKAQWVGPFRRLVGHEDRSINLLLLPWPLHVETDDFQVVEGRNHAHGKGEGDFDFRPSVAPSLKEFRSRVSSAFAVARRHAKRVDAVVLPELSLSLAQYFAAEEIAARNGSMIIAGVRLPDGSDGGVNACVMQPAGLLFDLPSGRSPAAVRKFRKHLATVRLAQSKHHRWCLDRQQITQYQLAGQMPTSVAFWENIQLLPRTLHFLTFGSWLTWSFVICEDLARQDPAADLIRSVGPNLLIALLMDGPQIQGRWPSRYASVLSEDPGSSVLTLSSLGMAERSRPVLRSSGRRADKSRAVALWRDAETGEFEISLDASDDACVISLTCSSKKELAADGRGDNNQAHFPVLAGYKSFRSGP